MSSATICSYGGSPVSRPSARANRFMPLIAELVRRDAPYYDAGIPPHTISAMNRFARAEGLLTADPPYDQIVALDIDRS